MHIRIALLAAALGAAPAVAQEGGFSLEGRLGVAVPQGEDTEGMEAGITTSLKALYQFHPNAGAYLGYGIHRFGTDEDAICEGDPDCQAADFEASARMSGFGAGLRLGLPMRGATPFVQGGAVYQRLTVSVDGDGLDFSVSSDDEWGFEVGGGVEVPVSPRLSITPAATYTKVEDAEYVRLDVGARFRL